MKKNHRARRTGILLAAAMVMALMSPGVVGIGALPDAIRLSQGEMTEMKLPLPGTARLEQQAEAVSVEQIGQEVSLTAAQQGEAKLVYRLLGMFDLKSTAVTVESQRVLIPGGRSVGVAMMTDGVVVAGLSDVGDTPSPARAAGLRLGDKLLRADGVKITNVAHLTQLIQKSGPIELAYERDGQECRSSIVPIFDASAGVYRLGAWVRDSTAGLGTLTYYDPASHRYGALGHAITDVDTSIVLPIGRGAIYESQVVGINKGRSGAPGELLGSFSGEQGELGSLEHNTEFGIFGALDRPVENPLYPNGIPVGTQDEVKQGPAQLLTTLQDGEIRAYDCEILRVYRQDAPSTRSMMLKVTDPELLAATGGIVQGMSGSPIVQDGKLIGAVTHVLINDPTRGYGIFIENMLNATA